MKKLSPFQHIYIEDGAREYPLTQRILSRYPKAQTIPINSYKEILNRSRGEWRVQKLAPKIILARKEKELLYRASSIAPSFGYKNFYYNTPLLNCIYDCSYCYLQGMFPNAHVVLFVNQEELRNAVSNEIAKVTLSTQTCTESDSLYLCLSYDTDILAFEGLLGLAKPWIDFARERAQFFMEIRTKSAVNMSSIEPTDRVIIAWTLSPETVIKRFEPGTPSLQARVKAIERALNQNWRVRICLDPILNLAEGTRPYLEMIDFLRKELPLEMMDSVATGTFRMNKSYFKNARRQQPNSSLFFDNYEKRDGIYGYPEKTESRLLGEVRAALVSAGIDKGKIVATAS